MKLQLIILALILVLPVVSAADINLDDLDVIKFTLTEGEDKVIQFNEEEYTIFADLVVDAEARVTFQPGNLALAIKREQSLDDIDIDNDGKIDFSISYLSSVDKKATIEIERLNLEAAAAEEKSEEKKSGLPSAEAITSALKQNLKYIIGAVVVLIILILVFSKRKGNPEKFYRRAESLHREAQEFHEDGDEETASELYQKAEELREKARVLEKGGL